MNPKLRRFLMTVVILFLGLLAGIGATISGLLPIGLPVNDQSLPSFVGTPPVEPSAGSTAQSTVELLAANDFSGSLNAAGNIELIETRQVVQKVSGDIQTIVAAGTVVKAGDPIATLDSADLARTLEKAEVEVELARLELAKVVNEANAAELALATANLLSAQENLAKIRMGATKEELAAAQSNNAAAWAKYQGLVAGSSAEKITAAKAALLKAEIDRAEAQRNYDAVAWQNDAGMSAQSAALQKATIEYERVKAEYDDASRPATQADLQSALSQAQKAQDELNRLKLKPTAAEVAEAEAKVAEAQAKLARLENGSSQIGTQSAELRVKKALIDLDEAQANLQQATIIAPIDGVILELKVKIGDRTNAGTVVATMADPHKLQLAINVAEADIARIHLGQQAKIALDALPDQALAGVVTQISPLSQTKREVISYPVIIQLTGPLSSTILSGMTAVATLEQPDLATDTWLVPSNSLQQQAGSTVVMVVRNDQRIPVAVTTGPTRGEWTQVQSAELQAGDRVVGTVASFVDQQPELIMGN